MIYLQRTNLHVGNYIIPLHGRKKMLQLLQCMLENPKGACRATIRQHIYSSGENGEKAMSFRLLESHDASLSKLISRTRRYLKLALADTPWTQTIFWFLYNDERKVWYLAASRDSRGLLFNQDQANAEFVPRNEESPPAILGNHGGV